MDIISTMSDSASLRKNTEQHKPKNTKSRQDDKAIYAAMKQCIEYLEDRLSEHLQGYRLEFDKKITFAQLISVIGNSGLRKEFDTTFDDRAIKPDGGVIFLYRDDDPDYIRIVLVAEAKRQGTNKDRIKEGKSRQAQGNAIERLGKNLTGIKAALNHEPLTPFVCFGQGCDFVHDYDNTHFVMSKISMMNEFYKLNQTYVFKRDGSSDKNQYSPVSMYFREEDWTQEEMFKIMKEIGETAIRYYIF